MSEMLPITDLAVDDTGDVPVVKPRASMDDLTFEHDAKRLGMRTAEASGKQREVTQRDADAAEFLQTWPAAGFAPKLEEYDYGAAREEGAALDHSMPLKHVRPGALTVAGYDLATQRKVMDPFGGYQGQLAQQNAEVVEGSGVGLPDGPNAGVRGVLHDAYMPARIVAKGVYGAIRGAGALARDVSESMADSPDFPVWTAPGGLKWVAEKLSKLNDLPEAEAIWETGNIIEELGADIVRFGIGYTAGAPLRLARGGLLAKEAVRGAQATQLFDPKEDGNIATALAEYGLLPEALRFLDSKDLATDGKVWGGRLAQAVEEGVFTYAMAGVVFGATLAARNIKKMEGENLVEQAVAALFAGGGSSMARQRGWIRPLADETPEGAGVPGGTGAPEQAAAPEGAGVPGQEAPPPSAYNLDSEEASEQALVQMAQGLQMQGLDENAFTRAVADLGVGNNRSRDIWDRARAPEIEAKLKDLETRVPDFGTVRQYMTPKELDVLVNQQPHLAAGKIRVAAEMMGRIDVNEMAGAALAGAGKRGWYKESAQALHDIFGPEDSRRFAALLAATSPRTSVESNLTNTVNIWANWVKAGRPTDNASIKRIMGQSVQGTKGEGSVLPAWVNNARAALQSTDMASLTLSGPKADSFMRNLQGSFDEVTNDTWMAHFGGVLQKDFSGSKLGDDPGKMGGYLGMSAATRRTAAYLSEVTGNQWSGAEVQETVWSFVKALYEKRVKEGFHGRNARELIAELNVLDTPDFGTLLEDRQVLHDTLIGAGYGPRLDAYAAGRQGRDAGPQGQADQGTALAPGGAQATADRIERLYRERAVAGATRPFRPGRAGTGASADELDAAIDDGAGTVAGAGRTGYRTDPRAGRTLDPLTFGGSGTRHEPSAEYKDAMGRVGVPAPPMFELGAKSKSHFKRALAARQALDPAVGGSSVTLRKSYADDRVFLADDGKAGFAVSKDGEVHSLFSSGGGVTPAMLQLAVENGGKWLVAFDTVLPSMYARSGFKPVARIAWDDEIAKKELKHWDKTDPHVASFNGGEPDLVFMAFDPDFDELVRSRSGGKRAKDYDGAMATLKKAMGTTE